LLDIVSAMVRKVFCLSECYVFTDEDWTLFIAKLFLVDCVLRSVIGCEIRMKLVFMCTYLLQAILNDFVVWQVFLLFSRCKIRFLFISSWTFSWKIFFKKEYLESVGTRLTGLGRLWLYSSTDSSHNWIGLNEVLNVVALCTSVALSWNAFETLFTFNRFQSCWRVSSDGFHLHTSHLITSDLKYI
jgi:hypothetical protein